MKKRFPGIDWYCDRCNAFLNVQDGFDDHLGTWECSECGYTNSISENDIVSERKALSIQRNQYKYFLSYEYGDEDEDEDEYGERISVYDAALIWLSHGLDEDYTFGYTEEELEDALK